MKMQRRKSWCMVLCAIAVTFTGANHAFAGQYASETLGTALPMWMETLASVNDEGDVAWTQWDQSIGSNVTNNATRARFYNDANDLLLPSASSAWAVGVSQRVTNGDNTVVAIAGSQASSQRMTDRSAMLWSVSWLTAGNGAATAIDVNLGEHTPKLAQGATGTVQQSAAYAVHVPPGSNANTYTVGGFARDKVDKSTYPQPVIWEVSQATSNPVISRQALTLLHPTAAVGSGYVASIAYNSDTHTTWACGNSTGNNAYNQATCWDISAGPASASVYDQLNNDLISSAGFSANVVSSMIHRVRTVPIGPNGALRTVAVGAALVGSGGSHQWKGFVYDLDGTGGDRLYKDLNLTSENETLAYDVAALTYVGNDNGVQTTSHGMIIAGISSTAPAATLGGLQGGPVGADTTKMTGVNRRMTLSGIADNGQVCAINDDSEFVTSGYDQLLALSPEGDHRLAMSGNQLVLLTAMPDAATVNILNRTTSSRLSTRTSARTIQTFHQAQAQLAGSHKALEGLLRFGSTLACDSLDNSSNFGAACAADPSTFDINNAADLTLSAYHASQLSSGASSVLNSAKVYGSAFDASSHAYAQVALRDSACTITPVLNASDVLVRTRDSSDGPIDSDFDGEDWTWCGAHDWVKTDTDVDNCSACGAQVQTLTCADTTCNAGTPTLGAIDANQCAIGPNNQWECYHDGNVGITKSFHLMDSDSADDCGNASATTVLDPCARCIASTDQEDWTTVRNTPCCDSSGNPILDVYDRIVSNAKGHPACESQNRYGMDKNSGFSRHAWWIDPRNVAAGGNIDNGIYTQGSYWSHNSVCNSGSSSAEPQDLTNRKRDTEVRRIRATFTPGIDEHDWYGVTYDDDPNNATTPKPRGRLLSHSTNPHTGERVRLRMCMYVDCRAKSANYVNIKHLFFRSTGTGLFYNAKNLSAQRSRLGLGTFRPANPPKGGWGGQIAGEWMFDPNHSNNEWVTARVYPNGPEYYLYTGNRPMGPSLRSPAFDARGPCFETNNNGVLDLTIYDYDCDDTTNEEAWVYYAVSLVDQNLEHQTCQDLKYTLFYGNDRDTASGQSAAVTPSHDNGFHPGCDTCCNDSW